MAEPSRNHRLLKVIFLLSIVAYFVAMAAGVYESIASQSRVPGVRNSYFNDLKKLREHEQYDRHIAQLRLALSLDFGHRFEGHFNLGEALAELGHYQEAAAHLREALQLKPNVFGGHILLGETLARQGQHQEAETHLREALSLDPDSAVAHTVLGKFLVDQGQNQEAITHLDEAIQLDPQLASAFMALGEAYGKQGRYGEAEPHLSQAVRLSPDLPESHYSMAIVLVKRRREEDAITHYREAIKLNPDMGAALNNLAWIYATHPRSDLRDAEEAVRLAERACQLSDRKVPSRLNTLAAAYAATGRFDEAVATAEEAIQLAIERGQQGAVAKIQPHLELYQQQRPYRQPVKPTER